MIEIEKKYRLTKDDFEQILKSFDSIQAPLSVSQITQGYFELSEYKDLFIKKCINEESKESDYLLCLDSGSLYIERKIDKEDYLSIEENWTLIENQNLIGFEKTALRVRLATDENSHSQEIFTLKLRLSDLETLEVNCTTQDYKKEESNSASLIHYCKRKIEKTRYTFTEANQSKLELDEFHNLDLIIAEKEFNNVVEFNSYTPDFSYQEDVSEDPNYKNERLAS